MPRLGGAVDLPQVGDPATPAAGRQFLYFKSDGLLYTKKPSGTVSAIAPVTSVATRTGDVALTAADIAGGIFPATGLAAYTFRGSPALSDGGGTSGTLALIAGYGGSTGFVGFYSNAGNRQGFIGDSNSNSATDTGALKYVAGSHTFSGSLIADALTVNGLTGARAGTRIVGATTSGAPTSGTWQVGDVVIARNGAIWVCTTAGSPGTWTNTGSGGGTAANVVVSSKATAHKHTVGTQAEANAALASMAEGDMYTVTDANPAASLPNVGVKVVSLPASSTTVATTGSLVVASYVIPAGTLKLNTVFALTGYGRVTTTSGSTGEIRAQVKIGGTLVAECYIPNMAINNTNRAWAVERALLVCSAVGTSGAVSAYIKLESGLFIASSSALGLAMSSAQTSGGGAPTPLTVDTTVNKTLELIVSTTSAPTGFQIFADMGMIELVGA